MLSHALILARKGMAVFPCRARDKRPATANGCKDATRDLALIRQWWEAEPERNIGVATGNASGIFALDIDGDGEGELRKLEAEHGELPNTVEVITPRGRHLYFRMPSGISLRNSASKLAPHCDVRADGGYVLAPPSIHPSGRRYAWSVDSGNSFAVAPDWLLDKIAEPANGNGKLPTPSEWRDLVVNGADEGQRDCSLTRLAGHLLRRYVDPLIVLELLHGWNATHCRPPLPMTDVERICNSIAGKEMRRRSHGD